MKNKIFIFGFGKSSRKMVDQLNENELKKITGFIDNDATKWGKFYREIECFSPYNLDCKEESVEIIFPVANAFEYSTIYEEKKQLLEYCRNIQIYICPTEFYKKNQKELNDIKNYVLGENSLINLAYFVRNDCNLKCRGCVAGSPLIKEPCVTSIDVFERDIKRLMKIYPHIENFSIQGGEILLDQSLLCKYIKIFRKYYKYTNMNILSNGVLALSLNSETINTLKKCNVQLRISLYPFLKNRINEIVKFLNNNEIDYGIHRAFEFSRLLTTQNKDGEIKSDRCFRTTGDTCFSISNGKFYRCQIPRSNKIFNSYWNINLPTDGEIDFVSEELTGLEIWKKLNRQLDACGYCNYCKKWDGIYAFPHTIVKESNQLSMEDWLVNE